MKNEKCVPIECKYCLTIDEASKYFNIGQKKIRQLVNEHRDEVVLQIGVKTLIKRKNFEEFINESYSV